VFAIQCALISLLTTFSASGSAPIGGYPLKYLFQRPFIGGLLVGMILGDVQQGVIIGCAMQLVYMGYFQVGGVGSMDMGIISFPCIAVAMTSGVDTTTAIALATGLATIFTSVDYAVRALTAAAGSAMKRAAEKNDWKGFSWWYVGFPTALYLVERGVTSFILIYFGSGAVEVVVNALPESLLAALGTVASWLPAIGMAALLGYLVSDAWSFAFFIFGWACYGYLGLSTTGVIFFAIVIALLYYRTMNKPAAAVVSADEEDEIE